MTTIYQIRDNLKRTIEGKEQALAEYTKALNVQKDPLDAIERMAITATKEFLEINLDELYGILNDVQECCKQATANSWIGVDRQAGI